MSVPASGIDWPATFAWVLVFLPALGLAGWWVRKRRNRFARPSSSRPLIAVDLLEQVEQERVRAPKASTNGVQVTNGHAAPAARAPNGEPIPKYRIFSEDPEDEVIEEPVQYHSEADVVPSRPSEVGVWPRQ